MLRLDLHRPSPSYKLDKSPFLASHRVAFLQATMKQERESLEPVTRHFGCIHAQEVLIAISPFGGGS